MSDDKAFIDTNILIYAHDRAAGPRHRIAKLLLERLWRQRVGVLSTQVLQEFYVNVRRKARKPVAPQEARDLVVDYLCWEVIVNDGRSVTEAADLEGQHRISFWDALIVQAANASGATVLYSEDLNHGQRYGNVRVVNPFLQTATLDRTSH